VDQSCQWLWLHRGIGLAMRIAATRAEHCAWYVIYPLDADRAATRAVLRSFKQPMPLRGVAVYHVRYLQAERLALGLMLQREDTDVECLEEFFAYGDCDLADRLQQRDLTLATFNPLITAAAHDARRRVHTRRAISAGMPDFLAAARGSLR
jgi:hypothetical protein